ncbi:conserved hypothetical protein [Methanocaldococcus sp. FS406-22]|nr:conserved hypothetical protein [Methanocaldococcus sp. FS406-22]
MNIGKVDNLKIYTLAEDYAGYNSPFWSQHGLSLLIEAEFNGIKRRILFDTASYAEPILFNMKLLNINPKSIDMIILSHNHFDHTGGLFGIIKEINKEIPIFAHPNIFKVSFAVEPEFMLAGTLNKTLKEEIEKLGGRWILSKDPMRLMPGIFTLGEIKDEEKVDFEKKPTIGLYKLENGRVVLDNVEDEIGLGIVTEKGLVVISGCAHPGIVSMVQKAINISGVNKVYAVIGGFHLIEADDKRIVSTIKALKTLGVKKSILDIAQDLRLRICL